MNNKFAAAASQKSQGNSSMKSPQASATKQIPNSKFLHMPSLERIISKIPSNNSSLPAHSRMTSNTNQFREQKKPPPLNTIFEEQLRNPKKELISPENSKLKQNHHTRYLSTESYGSSPLLFAPPAFFSPRSTETSFRKTFMGFQELMSTHRNEVKNFTQDLTVEKSDANHIKKQLAFNKAQLKLITDSLAQEQSDSQRMMRETFYSQQKKELKMPKIRMYPSQKTVSIVENGGTTPQGEGLATDSANHENKPKKVKLSAENLHSLFTRQVKLFKYKEQVNLSYRPIGRGGASFTILRKNGYLYGGRSHEPLSHIDIIDLETNKWTRLDSEEGPDGRTGHSACVYDENIIIFGGQRQFNPELKARECFNDVWKFSVQNHEWKRVRTTGEPIEPRRNHSAVIIGKNMVVYGGIDTNGNSLNDVKALNLLTMKWSVCSQEDENELGLAFHTACPIFHPERSKVELYRAAGHPLPYSSYIREEGMYVFGGKTENGEITNTLKVLKIFEKHLKWVTPLTSGVPPSPRIQHTMNHYQHLNCLIVYGGRNDQLSNGYFNDFGILWLEQLCWMQVNCGGEELSGRFAHCTGIYNSQLCILGGMNYYSYLSSDVELVELDQANAIRLQKDYGNYTNKSNYREVRFETTEYEEPNSPKKMKQDDQSQKKFVSFLPKPTKEELREEDKFDDLDNSNEGDKKFSRREKKRVLKAFFSGAGAGQLTGLLSPRHLQKNHKSPKFGKNSSNDTSRTSLMSFYSANPRGLKPTNGSLKSLL